MTATVAKLTAQERLEMLNLIIQETAPITRARVKLQQRYGKKAMIEIPGALGAETMDIVLPPMAARIDSELVQLDRRIRETILKEYGQMPEASDVSFVI